MRDFPLIPWATSQTLAEFETRLLTSAQALPFFRASLQSGDGPLDLWAVEWKL